MHFWCFHSNSLWKDFPVQGDIVSLNRPQLWLKQRGEYIIFISPINGIFTLIKDYTLLNPSSLLSIWQSTNSHDAFCRTSPVVWIAGDYLVKKSSVSGSECVWLRRLMFMDPPSSLPAGQSVWMAIVCFFSDSMTALHAMAPKQPKAPLHFIHFYDHRYHSDTEITRVSSIRE